MRTFFNNQILWKLYTFRQHLCETSPERTSSTSHLNLKVLLIIKDMNVKFESCIHPNIYKECELDTASLLTIEILRKLWTRMYFLWVQFRLSTPLLFIKNLKMIFNGNVSGFATLRSDFFLHRVYVLHRLLISFFYIQQKTNETLRPFHKPHHCINPYQVGV